MVDLGPEVFFRPFVSLVVTLYFNHDSNRRIRWRTRDKKRHGALVIMRNHWNCQGVLKQATRGEAKSRAGTLNQAGERT